MDEGLRKRLARFRNNEPKSGNPYRITKNNRSPVTRLTSGVSLKKEKNQTDASLQPNTELHDLRPSLDENLVVVFIGFNPGIQSSIQQHHYAHHSNLFWKLFNQAEILLRVLEQLQLLSEDYPQWIKDGVSVVKASDDFDLVKCRIGFTDLVLRCTKEALELSMEEKMANVPRLILEFSQTKVQNVVVVGKGIWEVVVKYVAQSIGRRFKLTKANFAWGQQKESNDLIYAQILRALQRLIGHQCLIFVFPNTSGLVTTMKFDEKLRLWVQLGQNIKGGV